MVNMHAQGSEPREITCSVIFPSSNGNLVWMIGDEVQTNNSPMEVTDDGYLMWQQSFKLAPSMPMNGKRFRCL